MAKQSPEQEAFQHRDKVNDTQMDPRTLEALQLEALNQPGNDRTQPKVESKLDGSSEMALANALNGIAEKALRLPAELRQKVVADNEGFIDPILLSVVLKPTQFQLGDHQNPQEVLAFLAKLERR